MNLLRGSILPDSNKFIDVFEPGFHSRFGHGSGIGHSYGLSSIFGDGCTLPHGYQDGSGFGYGDGNSYGDDFGFGYGYGESEETPKDIDESES